MNIEKIITVSPRGFCAGVARSIKVVEDCLEIFGAPIYIKHAIVHNKTVVADLEAKGAITVEDVDAIPEGAVAVFSAHGSPPEHFAQARRRSVMVIDATCPLVTKVHIEIARYVRDGKNIVYIGHHGHVEGLGVLGEAEKMGITVPLIDSVEEVENLSYPENQDVVILTQTTLSVEETQKIIAAIKEKYPQTLEPPAQDICYATTNRQGAIKKLADEVDVVLIVGSQTSSNSNRLVETARDVGVEAYLLDSVEEIKREWLADKKIVGLSAGASAPEYKVQEIVQYFIDAGAEHIDLMAAEEHMTFTEPVELTRARNERTSQ